MENETIASYLDETNKLPTDFDWKLYLIKNVDLILAGINNENHATTHYLDHGLNEHRVYYENDKITNFVHCGGKCGSSTLYTTMMKNHMKTIHSHSDKSAILDHNMSIYTLINDNKKQNEKIYLIDSYRNPIERKMSSFFQSLQKEKYDWPMSDLMKEFDDQYLNNEYIIIINFKSGSYHNIEYLVKKISEDIVIDEAYENYMVLNMINSDNLNILCNLLDKNKESLGIMSYKKLFINRNDYYHSIDELFRHFNISERLIDFNFDKKYGMYKHENMVFIKVRFCDIKNWDKILSDIFGKEITIFSANLSENKEYYDLYKKFKSQYKVPRFFLKGLLKDEHFNLYNTFDERKKYLNYWLARSC